MKTNEDQSFLEAALLGFQQQRAEVMRKISDLQGRLGTRASNDAPAPRRKGKRHKISAEGRARIAAAQKKRWAEKKRANA